MEMAVSARQISLIRPLPVNTRYRIPPDRMRPDNGFALSIMSKYMPQESLELPSVSFVYPKMAEAAEETLDKLAAQMITFYRVRARMDVHNHFWLQNYAVSLSSSCEQLLRQLTVQAPASMGAVSPGTVREMERIYREIAGESSRQTAGIPAAQAGAPAARGQSVPAAEEQEGETILRILTAASRGNGTRERYLSALYRRMEESRGGTQLSTAELLARAPGELLRIGREANEKAGITGWASEQARQFFWRIQRAPAQEREIFLRAGGFTTVVALERSLQSMDDRTFLMFSQELAERLRDFPEVFEREPGETGTAERLIREMSAEDWTVFTRELERIGYVFRDGNLVTLEAEDLPRWASEQARQLFWRIQRAPEQERAFFLRAGGFSSMESLEKLFRTMDDVTFRQFTAQILERLTQFSEVRKAAEAEGALPEAGGPPAFSGEETALTAGASAIAGEAPAFSHEGSLGFGMPAPEMQEFTEASPERRNVELILRQSISRTMNPDGSTLTGEAEEQSPEEIQLPEEIRIREEKRIQEEKKSFTDRLQEGGEAAALLLKVLTENTEKREWFSESRELFSESLRDIGTVSEKILQMTDYEWQQFRSRLPEAALTEPAVAKLLQGNDIPELTPLELVQKLREESASGEQVYLPLERLLEQSVLRQGAEAPGTETSAAVPESAEAVMQFIKALPAEEWGRLTGELEENGYVFREDRDGLVLLRNPGSREMPAAAGAPRHTEGERIPEEPGSSEERRISEEERISDEKRIFTEKLREAEETAAPLRRMLLENIERKELLGESGRVFTSVAEAILNMTSTQWRQFRDELAEIGNTEEAALLPADIQIAVQNSAKTAAPISEGIASQDFPETEVPELMYRTGGNAGPSAEDPHAAGIRMSREKQEMIAGLRALSRAGGPGFLQLERLLERQTVLGQMNIGVNGQQYLRELSYGERQNWAVFIRDLFRETEPGSISPDRILVNIRNHYAPSFTAYGTGEERGSAAALTALEHLRETRVLQPAALSQTGTPETLGDGALQMPGSAVQETYLRMAAAGQGERTGETANRLLRAAGQAEETAELPSPVLEVPRRQAAAQEATAENRSAQSAPERTVYRDIEFETVTHTTDTHIRHESGTDLQGVLSQLEQQQKEIDRIRRNQEKEAARNVPRELWRKLEEQARMERLRGGR